MTISEIAKKYGVSDSTARRRMAGSVPRVKTVKETIQPPAFTRETKIGDYTRDDVRAAFAAARKGGKK